MQHSAFIDLRHVNFLFAWIYLCGTGKQFVSPDAYMRAAGKNHIQRPLNVRYILFMNRTLVNMVPVPVRM